MPSNFPDAQFEALKDRVVAKLPNPSEVLEQLLGGHNGVRFRLRACADYSDEFIESVLRVGNAPPIEKRYQQERQLFGFFVSGLASLESFIFFLYFMGVPLRPEAFLIAKPGHLKSISLKATTERYKRKFSSEGITTALEAVLNNSLLEEWEDCRNILAHRAAPGRNLYASVGSTAPDPPASWKLDPTRKLLINETLTRPRLDWLISTLADLIARTDTFTQKYF